MVSQPMLEAEVWRQVSKWVALLAAPGSKALQDVNEELRRVWKSNGGTEVADVQHQMAAVEKKIANVRAAIEEGVSDVRWASARLEELHTERARLQGQLTAVPAEPPVIERTMLARCASDLPRLLDEATTQERRELVRRFVERMELDPETREIDVEFRLPANCAKHVEAAARIAMIGTVLARHARVLLRCVGGKGRRAAAVVQAAGR
jgi:hypothetical protein